MAGTFRLDSDQRRGYSQDGLRSRRRSWMGSKTGRSLLPWCCVACSFEAARDPTVTPRNHARMRMPTLLFAVSTSALVLHGWAASPVAHEDADAAVARAPATEPDQPPFDEERVSLEDATAIVRQAYGGRVLLATESARHDSSRRMGVRLPVARGHRGEGEDRVRGHPWPHSRELEVRRFLTSKRVLFVERNLRFPTAPESELAMVRTQFTASSRCRSTYCTILAICTVVNLC